MPLHLRAGHPRAGVVQLLLVRPEDRKPGDEADDPDGADARRTRRVKDIHYKALGNANFEPILQVLWRDLKPLEDLPNYEAYVLNPYQPMEEKQAAAQMILRRRR